jgi:hypothetical protein
MPTARPVLAGDTLGDDALQALLGGGRPDSGALVDEARAGLPGRPGKLQFLQPRTPLVPRAVQQQLPIQTQQVKIT